LVSQAHENTPEIPTAASTDELSASASASAMPTQANDQQESHQQWEEGDLLLTQLMAGTNGASQADQSGASVSSDSTLHTDSGVPAPPAATASSEPRNDVRAWSSAAKTRDFLESLPGARKSGALARLWQTRRGDFYLAVALILVVIVIRWGMWSNHSVAATGHGAAVPASVSHPGQPAAEPELSLYDRLLIALGLEETPEPPQYKGNPETQVWVDTHTALYYCPGADLYGKTPQGKLTRQRDAQLDQFEPANRKPCD